MTRRRPGFAGPLQSPLTDSNRRPPPYHPSPVATGCNLRQRFPRVFASFGRGQFATDCHCLQPRGYIRAPSFVIRRCNRPRRLSSAWTPSLFKRWSSSLAFRGLGRLWCRLVTAMNLWPCAFGDHRTGSIPRRSTLWHVAQSRQRDDTVRRLDVPVSATRRCPSPASGSGRH